MRLWSRFLLFLALAGLGGCATQSVLAKSRSYSRLGDFQHAYEVLDQARRERIAAGDTIDEELAAEHERIRREFLRWRARTQIFQEREDDALRDLDALAAADPDYPELQALRDRALGKKAGRIVVRADELLAQRDFAGAMQLYLESQKVVPDFAPAQEGMKRVREEMARLSARAQQQFLEAVRKVPEFRFVEVQWHAANVMHNEPDRADAEALEQRAKGENAQAVFERGRECERADKFGAALVLYKNARELDPDLPGVDAAIEKMKREMEALSLIEQAQVEMRNARFDVARELLGRAFEQSTLSRGAISELMIEARKLEGERHYRAARDLQVMGKKAEALAAFEALKKDWPESLQDTDARIAGLRVDVDGAVTEWAEAEAAEAAGDLPAALDHYINAERYYPQWRDGEKQIERLRAAIAEQAKKAGEGSGGEAPAPGGQSSRGGSDG